MSKFALSTPPLNPSSPGACLRCKNLKVRCEFETETDPCKRCLKGGSDCIIPGRKKRKTPPKREHLIKEIRDQASQIQHLMAQLEALGAPQNRNATSATGSTPSSPVLSPSSTTTSFLDGDSSAVAPAEKVANKAVEDWIAKAKESLEEFGGFIGIGGAGMPQSYLIQSDLEGSQSSEEEDYVEVEKDPETTEIGGANDQEYEFAVENSDGETMSQVEGISGLTLRHKSSSSSIGTNATGATGGVHARKRDRPAILPREAAPFGLFGDLALKAKRGQSAEPAEKAPGIAGKDYFQPSAPTAEDEGRLKNIQQPPHILTKGIVTPQEAEKLFKIYFDFMNLSVSLLDPVLYTAQRTCYRSPFLFTVICAIASRFYSERPELYPQAMHYAQLAAGTALISGRKNVELCQAYILLSLYPVPAKRWEDQRSWLYLGLAIRTATDLNLHLPNTAKPVNEYHAREMLNRTRVWLNCFNLDRSTGSQYGKPPIISSADYMANHSQTWWQTSPHNMHHFDIHICAYNSELKVMAGFLAKIYSDPDHPTGLNKEVDFEGIATETDDSLKHLGEQWFDVLNKTDMTDPQNCFRTGLLKLAYSYARLIALSYGFQHAFGKNNTDENPFLLRCLSAASDVVDAVVNDICKPTQIQYFRHGPEAQSVFVTFASAFLVKLLQPRFATYLPYEKRLEVRGLVQKVVDLLGSPEVAIDDRHGPKLYSRFLKGLLASPMARVENNMGAHSPYSRPRPRKPRSSDIQGAFTPGTSPSLTHQSYRTSPSLSPPPNPGASSFDVFAPAGPVDPFAPDVAANMDLTEELMGAGVNMSELFQPPLAGYDDQILQGMNALTGTNGSWQGFPMASDTDPIAGSGWMAQFQQNLGMDMRAPDGGIFYDTNYMTGP
ncbi:hypothetical protein BD779DRAFT_1433309 [Infundibulicybe gibba]|nr:hypothetical protein BD779DRAFT_1433309 [Infundibulicybe gibba]